MEHWEKQMLEAQKEKWEDGDGSWDREWYVADSEGYIAIFCTNGFGFNPIDYDGYEVLGDWYDSLKKDKKSSSSISVPNGYWKNTSKKGLFAFDYTTEHCCGGSMPNEGHYERVAVPEEVEGNIMSYFDLTDEQREHLTVVDFKFSEMGEVTKENFK